jgi:hypothetical protein
VNVFLKDGAAEKPMIVFSIAKEIGQEHQTTGRGVALKTQWLVNVDVDCAFCQALDLFSGGAQRRAMVDVEPEVAVGLVFHELCKPGRCLSTDRGLVDHHAHRAWPVTSLQKVLEGSVEGLADLAQGGNGRGERLALNIRKVAGREPCDIRQVGLAQAH